MSEETSGNQLRGPELARAVLEAARAGSKNKAGVVGRARVGGSRRQPGRRGGYSGAGADARDPQLVSVLVSQLIADRGWQRPTAEARLLGDWERLVGKDIAAKCQPVSLRDGELVLQAQSTAWAIQLRQLMGKLLKCLRAEVGDEVVKTIRVHGPAGPSWKRGPRSVPGLGPRDTYG